MIDLLTFGETMISVRASGALVSGATCTTHVAGAESNVAIALSRLGHRTAWVGALSADPLGDLVATTLAGEGVEVVRADADGRQAGMMVLQQRTADAAAVTYVRDGSAGSALAAADVLPTLAEGVRRLHVSGITPALSAAAREATLAAVTRAAADGVAVSLDINYRGALWSREQARAALAPLLPHVETLIASCDELDLAGVAGAGPQDVIATLTELGCAHVVIKRGAGGADLVTDGITVHADAVPVTVIDVVGAGDAFTAGYLSGRLDGLTDRDCLERGVTLGAFAVSTRGDWEGLPRRAELGMLHGGVDVAR